MQDTYSVTSVVKTIGSAGTIVRTDVDLQNTTNTFGPPNMHITLNSDFVVKPGDTHVLSIA